MPRKQQLHSLERDAQQAAAAKAQAEEQEEEEDEAVAAAAASRKSDRRRATSVSSSLLGEFYPSSIAKYPHFSSGFRLKRAFLVARRGGPSTPVPSWKFFENPFSDAMAAVAAEEQQLQHHQGRRLPVSARRLAATLWELQEVPLTKRGSNRIQAPQEQHQQCNRISASKRLFLHGQFLSPASSRISRGSYRRTSIQYKQPHSRGKAAGARSQLLRLLARHRGRRAAQLTDGTITEVGAAGTVISPSNTVLDVKAIPRDLGCGPTTTTELLKVLNHVCSLEEQHASSMSLVATLRCELEIARKQLQELKLNETTHHTEVEDMTKIIAEEQARWREQQQENIRLAVQSIRMELEDERKAKQRLEMLHKRVARDLHEVKRTLLKSVQDLERERKARELMEDVCDELAREIGDDKARVEELKRESLKVREEVEQERKMLQMAEIWREERVQMKLMEAKLELEEKNTALDKLRSELESFLKAKRAGGLKDEGNHTTKGKQDIRRHSLDAVVGRNLAFYRRQGMVSGRNTIDSLHGSESRPSARNTQEPDDDVSGDDDDLHSIEPNNEPFVRPSSSQWGQHSCLQQDVENRGRRSIDQRVSSVDKLKQWQAGQSQGVERTRSAQFDSGMRGEDGRENDTHWEHTQDSQWIERQIERGEMREWSHQDRGSLREEIMNSWQSDNEDPERHLSLSSKAMGRNIQGHNDSFFRAGGIELEDSHPHYREAAHLDSSGSNLDRQHHMAGGVRDLHADSVYAPMHQLPHVTSSPTRQWNHYWCSPEAGRLSKDSSEISKGFSDNSLAAKLLEAKLESQQPRLRGRKGF